MQLTKEHHEALMDYLDEAVEAIAEDHKNGQFSSVISMAASFMATTDLVLDHLGDVSFSEFFAIFAVLHIGLESGVAHALAESESDES